MGKWLNGCEICTIGLVNEVNRLKEAGLSEMAACRRLATLAEKKFGAAMWTAEQIRMRYRYHYGLDKNEPVEILQDVAGKPSENGDIQPTLDKKPKKSENFSPAVQTTTASTKVQSPEPEDVVIDPSEVGAAHYVETQIEIQRANKPAPSELERAEKTIISAAHLLERIVAGDLKDNGSDYDRLTAASIRRHLPGIIISAIQLGIDIFKVHDFYMGDQKNESKPDIEGYLEHS